MDAFTVCIIIYAFTLLFILFVIFPLAVLIAREQRRDPRQ